MSKQVYVDCNRINTDDSNNDETNIWTYKLRNEMRLPANTQISLSNTFLNQKGINGSSIEFEDDIKEKIAFFVYVQEGLHPIPAYTGTDRTAQLFTDCLRNYNYSKLISGTLNANSLTKLESSTQFGGSNIPLVLYEPYVTLGDGRTRIKPVVKFKSIKIKKGVYGINQLNDIINNQINLKLTLEQEPRNIIDGVIQSADFRGNLGEDGAGLTHIITPFNAYSLDQANQGGATYTNSIIQGLTGGNHVLIPINVHRTNLETYKDLNTIPDFDWLLYLAGGESNMFSILVDNQVVDPTGTGAPNVDVQNYNLGFKKYCLGSTEFNMDYNSSNSSFSINNLHSSYRIPTLDAASNANLNEGESAICLRSPAINELGDESNAVQEVLRSTLRTPITRQGGVIIYNFSFNRSVQEAQFGIGVAHNDFYSFKQHIKNDKKARNIWKKTLWNRLGFSYEQLNEDSYFERYKIYNLAFNNETDHIGGITTNGDLDLSISSELSCKQNPFVLSHIKTNVITGGFSGFNFVPSNTPKNSFITPSVDNNNNVSYNGSIYNRATVINVLGGGRPLLADNLPTLSIHGYYLITSDIIPSYNDIVGNSTPLALIGVVPKSSLSNQDFIEATNQITNILTNPIIINSIKIQVLNPDMTAPSLSDNSSCILRFDIPEDPQTDNK